MHYVGRIDAIPVVDPWELAGAHLGLTRQTLVGRSIGSVHTQVDIHHLAPDGEVRSHMHSFEEAHWVLEGEPAILLDGRAARLTVGDYVLVPVGSAVAWANPGDAPARWLSASSPVRLDPDAGRRDTFVLPHETWDPGAAPPIGGGPIPRLMGNYVGTPPQAEALRLGEPARGRKTAGRDTALVMYSGISLKLMVDPTFGADLLTMFTIDYEAGGSAQIHDHPFEEAYVFMGGECEGEFEGTTYTLRAGDFAWAGVGALHGFLNDGPGRVRWLETQMPQPPRRNSYRWYDDWKRFEI